METRYRHLSEYERDDISSCLRVGMSKSETARRIGRNRSAVCREIARNNLGRFTYDSRNAGKIAKAKA
jgi:IS30 family transposase